MPLPLATHVKGRCVLNLLRKSSKALLEGLLSTPEPKSDFPPIHDQSDHEISNRPRLPNITKIKEHVIEIVGCSGLQPANLLDSSEANGTCTRPNSEKTQKAHPCPHFQVGSTEMVSPIDHQMVQSYARTMQRELDLVLQGNYRNKSPQLVQF